jgi:hypothetical protein
MALFADALNLYPTMESFRASRNSPSTQVKREVIVSIQIDLMANEGSMVEFISPKITHVVRFAKGEDTAWVDVLKKTWGEEYFLKAVTSPRYQDTMLDIFTSAWGQGYVASTVSPRKEPKGVVSPRKKEVKK